MKHISTLLYIVVFSTSFSCSESTSDDIIDTSVDTTNDESMEDTTSPPDMYFPSIDTDIWETTNASNLGWNTEALSPLYDFLEEKNTESFIILKNGKIVIESYFNGGSALDNNAWNSVGKTLIASIVGIAQQEGFLNINASSATYLGSGWSNLTQEQENEVTVKHHLTMTSGLDYTVTDTSCTDKECLNYLNEPGSFWYYHNAPYTLLHDITENATNKKFSTYFNAKIKDKIGMNGAWISLGNYKIYYSTARSMARFGLLILNEGIWNSETILTDSTYFNEMVNTSQELNPAYGYLWWLNGKSSYKIPASTLTFEDQLIPNAPNDLITGLGKNDQKLYVVPSENLVIVRMGNDTGETLLGPSSFDNELWEKINTVLHP